MTNGDQETNISMMGTPTMMATIMIIIGHLMMIATILEEEAVVEVEEVEEVEEAEEEEEAIPMMVVEEEVLEEEVAEEGEEEEEDLEVAAGTMMMKTVITMGMMIIDLGESLMEVPTMTVRNHGNLEKYTFHQNCLPMKSPCLEMELQWELTLTNMTILKLK